VPDLIWIDLNGGGLAAAAAVPTQLMDTDTDTDTDKMQDVDDCLSAIYVDDCLSTIFDAAGNGTLLMACTQGDMSLVQRLLSRKQR
jgi:hypothetical protein